MPRYRVTVKITRKLDCWSDDENEAIDKACEIVSGWQNVDDVEAVDAEWLED